MPKKKFNVVLQNLQKKDYHPVYFFHGEEPYFIDELVSEIEQNALPEAQQSFNQTIIYGKDVAKETGKIIDNAMRLPMMAEKQVIIVKEAQNISNWAPLQSYIQQPTKSTILVLAHKNKKIDGRKTFGKLLKKHAIVVDSDPLRDYQIPDWIQQFVNTKGYNIDKKSSELLVEFLGTDIAKIVNELEKLFLVLQTKKITPAAIEENIGISKDYNVFELNNAILARNSAKTFRIIDYFRQNPKAGHIVHIIGSLNRLFSNLFTIHQMPNSSDQEISKATRIHTFFLKDYRKAVQFYNQERITRNFKLLKEFDLRAKGLNSVNTSSEELLRELSFKLMMR